MSATGVIWLSAFSLSVGVVLAALPRFWERRLVAAWYLWLGGVGLSALIVGQIVVALMRTGRYRLEDPGPTWLGASGFDVSLSVDPTAVYGAAGVLALVLSTGALVTQIGVRVEPFDRSSLARLAGVAGGACLMMSARGFVLVFAGWAIAARAMLGGRVDPRARVWAVAGDLGVAIFVLALIFGAELRDLSALNVFDLSVLRAPLMAWGGLEVSVAEVASWGLALAILARCTAPTGSWQAGGGAGAYATARTFAGAVVPWVVLSLRSGRLLAHAPWGMVVITLVGVWLTLGGALRVARSDADASTRVAGYARAQAGVPIVAVGLGNADLALAAAVIGAGNAVTYAMAGGRVPMRGLGRWAAFAWLGSAPFSTFLLQTMALGWARGHDSAASMGINWVTWAALLLAQAVMARGLAESREDVHDGAQGAEDLRLGSWAAMVWGLITWGLVWPGSVGSISWLGAKLGLSHSYGLVFAERFKDLYVGLRPDFVGAAGELVISEWLLAAALSALVPPLAFAVSRRSLERGVRLPLQGALDRCSQFEARVGAAPAALLSHASGVLRALHHRSTETLPALLESMVRASAGDLAAGVRERPWLRAWGRLPWPAMILTAIVLGWVFFKPAIIDFGPNEFHGFGGLAPRLQRPLDPSRERARAKRRAELGSPQGAASPQSVPPEGPQAKPALDPVDGRGALEPAEVPQ